MGVGAAVGPALTPVTIHALRSAPEEMTGRARLYLLVAFAYQCALAWFLLTDSDGFTSTSFEQIRKVTGGSLEAWGALFLIAATLSLVAAATRHERTARLSLMMTAAATYTWAGGFFAALQSGDLAGPTAPIGWLTIAVIHTIMASNPIRTPFERIKRRVLGSAERISAG